MSGDEGGDEAAAEVAPPPVPVPEVNEKHVAIGVKLLGLAAPGEFDDCAHAMKVFASEPAVADQARTRAAKGWFLQHASHVDIDDHKALLVAEAEQPDGQFFDPTTGSLFEYDFLTRAARTVGPGSGSAAQGALQPQIAAFVASEIPKGVGGVYDVRGGLAIVISAHSVSKENFRTGTLLIHLTLSSGILRGYIEVIGHFYENGNANAYTKSDLEASPGEDPAAVVKQVQQWYKEWTAGVAKAFDLLVTEGLDRLRRKLPVTKTQVNWRMEVAGTAGMAVRK